MNIELIGTTASILVLISFLFNDLKTIRIINIIGSLIFMIYASLISSFSIWFLNIILVIINIVKIFLKK